MLFVDVLGAVLTGISSRSRQTLEKTTFLPDCISEAQNYRMGYELFDPPTNLNARGSPYTRAFQDAKARPLLDLLASSNWFTSYWSCDNEILLFGLTP